ncbi:flagellar brake protein YcgR [Methylocaldum marinum]|uniref:Flagellar brake protein YcgR n=1 Tax=Methylocaldum marinum TaxID=1432792 RepID=A0A250KR67_9GAMM|nr:flagellar brake protein [Methylocaldum marinum]BBA34155.1 flagellar brake protein YcgR [Methylocaldum marinum]
MPADSNETQGAYLLKGRGEILEKLKLMQAKKCLLSAQTDGAGSGFVTTVVQVMPEKGLVVLDPSENADTNRQMLAAPRVVFRGQVDGIQSSFVLTGLIEANLNEQTVLAAAIPDALYWRQRRKFYRATIPVAMPAKCVVSLDGQPAEFGIADISVSGLALIDKICRLGDAYPVGHILEECRLILPGHGETMLGLELRNKAAVTWGNSPIGQRVGCLFRGAGRNFEARLQKFIYDVELLKKRQDGVMR